MDMDIAIENLKVAIERQKRIDGRIQVNMNLSVELSASDEAWENLRRKKSVQYRRMLNKLNGII